MVNWQFKSRRKPTGGIRKTFRKKRRHELGSSPVETLQGPRRVREARVRGGNKKRRLLQEETVNVTDFKGVTTGHVKIISVVHNSANKEYDRRKIITKGTILETELGLARVTSRPGQDGQLNAVLVKEE